MSLARNVKKSQQSIHEKHFSTVDYWKHFFELILKIGSPFSSKTNIFRYYSDKSFAQNYNLISRVSHDNPKNSWSSDSSSYLKMFGVPIPCTRLKFVSLDTKMVCFVGTYCIMFHSLVLYPHINSPLHVVLISLLLLRCIIILFEYPHFRF